MIQRPSPFISSTLRLVGVVVMAEILALGVLGQYILPSPAEPSTAGAKVENLEREARAVLEKFQRGEIQWRDLPRQLEDRGIRPAFLGVLMLQGLAMAVGALSLIALAALRAFGVRLKPRGNWAPGTPWLPLDAVEAVLCFGCAQLVLGTMVALLLRGSHELGVEGLRPEHLLLIYVVAAAVTLGLLSRRTAGGLRRLWHAARVRAAPVLLRMLQGGGGYMAALPLLLAARYLNPIGDDPLSSNPVISMLMARRSALDWILLFVVIGLCAPVFEELLFRGCAYPAFRRRWGVGVAVVASGLLFGAVHGQLAELVPLTVLGIVFAALYETTGSLVPSIIAHSLQNSITLLQLMWLSG